MYTIIFYRTESGKEPVLDFIRELQKRKDKDARINAAKINDYLEILKTCGKAAGEPFVKPINGDIWELRPIRNRILFVAWTGECFVLLHCFVKKTRKTPKNEIEKAKREYEDFRRRNGNGRKMDNLE